MRLGVIVDILREPLDEKWRHCTVFADEQAVIQVSLLKAPQPCKNDVHVLSQQIDKKVSTLQFPALGAELDVERLTLRRNRGLRLMRESSCNRAHMLESSRTRAHPS